MTKTEKNLLLWGAIGAGALLLFAGGASFWPQLKNFVAEWESYSATPYWDANRYSWGYGTKAPGSSGYIDRERAWQEMTAHLENDYRYLKPLISRNLAPNQWAALLSMAYNTGPGNADNLVSNINSGNWPALESQWKQYIYSNGVPLQSLRDRRAAEWELFEG